MTINDSGIPDELKQLNQWVCYRLKDDNKEPFIPGTEFNASNKNFKHWRSYQIAMKACENSKYDGISFAIGKPYCVIDLDDCIDAGSGEIHSKALEIIRLFDSYTEISVSGCGIHIIFKAELTDNKTIKKTLESFKIEIFGLHFITLTGNLFENRNTIQERQSVLDKFITDYDIFKKPEPKPTVPSPGTSTSALSDQEIIEKASKAKNADKFNRLISGQWQGNYQSQSEADLALCCDLSFWTQDIDQIDRLFRQSELNRDKWDRADYRNDTINKALELTTEHYTPGTQSNHRQKTKAEAVEPSASGDQESEADSKSKKKEHNDSQATILVKLCQQNNVELWHTKDKQAMATFLIDNHYENWTTNSKTFKEYLQRLYFENCKTAPGKSAIIDAIGVIDGLARWNGIEKDIFTRLAYVEDKIYFDLCNDTWQVIEIDSTGWRVLDISPVAFRRGRGMLALPIPTQQGNISALFDIFEIEAKTQALILSWLIGAMNQKGPFPILVINGEQGSGKSTLCKLLKNILDPGITSLKSIPREERDLIISASNSWLLSYDNISGFPEWISDAMCRLSTGGGISLRELYSDSEEMIFDVKRPLVLNGIENIGLRSDFSDRTILISLPKIEKRLDEKSMNAKFAELHTTILGGLCDATAMALKNIDTVKLDNLPRMADFALWITASEPALGVRDLVGLYQANRDEQSAIVLGASIVGSAVMDFMATRTLWEGTLKQLLDELDTYVDATKRREKSYPKDATRFSSKLRIDAPSLRHFGIDIEFGEHSRTGNLVKLKKCEAV